ncbi:MAG: shikimate dehydrogenase, partial [Sphingomonas sp.]
MTPYAEVIGDPIAHSKSPLIHRFWLEALGLEGDYRATRVAPGDLAAFFADRAADPAWRGCNITVPHKVAALDHVADPGDVRASIGAINTVFRGEDGALAGTNTDAAGFWAPIAELDLADRPVTVVGAGGAAR